MIDNVKCLELKTLSSVHVRGFTAYALIKIPRLNNNYLFFTAYALIKISRSNNNYLFLLIGYGFKEAIKTTFLLQACTLF